MDAQGLFGKFQEPEQSLVKQRTFANPIFPLKVPHFFVAQVFCERETDSDTC